jgi:hypothetical protein
MVVDIVFCILIKPSLFFIICNENGPELIPKQLRLHSSDDISPVSALPVIKEPEKPDCCERDAYDGEDEMNKCLDETNLLSLDGHKSDMHEHLADSLAVASYEVSIIKAAEEKIKDNQFLP